MVRMVRFNLALFACTMGILVMLGLIFGAVAPAFAEETTVTIWGWWDIRMDLFEEEARQFESEHPDVKIKVETIPFDALWQKVYPAVAAGNAPTMLLQKVNKFFEFKDAGILAPYPKTYFPRHWLEENYPGVNWDVYADKPGGQPYVMPGGAMPGLLLYNKGLFAGSGLDPVAPPATWDQMVQNGKKLTKFDANGEMTQAGLLFGPEYPPLDWIYQLGGNIFKREANTRVSTMHSPEVKEAVGFLADLFQKYKISDMTFPVTSEALGLERTGMVVGESYIDGNIKSGFPEVHAKLGYSHIPTPTGKANPYYGRKSALLLFSVLAGRPSNEREAAFKFLKYMLRDKDDLERQYASLLGGVPEARTLWDDPAIMNNPIQAAGAKYAPDMYDFVEPSIELSKLLEDLMNRIGLVGMSAEQSLQIADNEWSKLLREGVAPNLK